MESMKKPIIAFLGDGITAGEGASDEKHSFCARLEEMTGFVVENNGVAGSRIARGPQTNSKTAGAKLDFVKRVASLDDKADVVFVFGGNNDFREGEVELGKAGDKDSSTFYGAVAILCDVLLKKYRREQLVFVLPLPRFDEENPRVKGKKKKTIQPLSAYRFAIEEAASSYGIFVLDLAGIFPLPQNDKGDEYTADGIHPNDRGHDLLAQIFTCYLWDHYRFEPRCFPKEDPLK
jgi:lysophospholipase L1-like esterase